MNCACLTDNPPHEGIQIQIKIYPENSEAQNRKRLLKKLLKRLTILLFILLFLLPLILTFANFSFLFPGIQTASASPNEPENAIEENLTNKAPIFGQIEILTNPNGSEIYLNEKLMGKTPALIESVPPGFYEIVLKQTGYNDVFERVLVKAGEKAEISKNLILKDGVCSISSNPGGASVYLDGKYKGVTPVVFYANEGIHKLTIKKNGYSTVSREINASYDKTYVFEEKLHLNLLVYPGIILIFLAVGIFAKRYSEKFKTGIRIKIPVSSGSLRRISKRIQEKRKKEGGKIPNFQETEKKEDITEKSSTSDSLIELEKYSEPKFGYTIKKKGRD